MFMSNDDKSQGCGAIFSQACAATPDEVAEGDWPRFAVLEVKPLMAALDMKETVMETLLSHLEVGILHRAGCASSRGPICNIYTQQNPSSVCQSDSSTI